MTGNYKDLYIADSITALNRVAHEKMKSLNIPLKFERKCQILDKLYKSASENSTDQEIAYVLTKRFILTFELFSKIKKDQHFMHACYSTYVQKCKQQNEQLLIDLRRRYDEKQAKENKKPVETTKISTKQKKKFPDNYISCIQLYSALDDPKNNILLVDTRPEEEFKQSRINIGKIINVPDNIIKSGLSAHLIGNDLPSEYRALWNIRETFDVMILIDLNSTHDNMTATKLEKLLISLVDWDVNKNYVQEPIILNGGYMEWAQKYPTLCLNPNFVINEINNELDELLNLDDIQYPTEENKVPILAFQEIKPNISDITEEGDTREELIRKNKDLSLQRELLLNELITKENKWKEIQNNGDTEALIALEKDIANSEKKFALLTTEKNTIQEKFNLFASFDPQNENLQVDDINEMVKSDELDKEKQVVLNTVAQQRMNELAKARALKPKAAGEPSITSNTTIDDDLSVIKNKKPIINRSTKPPSLMTTRIFEGVVAFGPEGSGLVGLKNIKNTCYMNAVIQCMRNLYDVAMLFCCGNYQKHIRRNPDAIVMATAYLFRTLTSKVLKVFNPIKFYERVCSIEPNYHMGNHEDCMEFFLFLLNNLNEDCAYDKDKPKVMSPAQQAWFNQLGGKVSIFTELFYHQIRITQHCDYCNTSTYKFEIESTIMLPVPDYDFDLRDLLNNYMDDYVIDDYCCAKCKKPVKNSKKVCFSPKILVLVLKRYKPVVTNNFVTLTKVNSKVHFPLNNLQFGDSSYNLNSIAMHSGTMTSGHYTAACLNNFKWYEFNDEIVRPIKVFDDSVGTKACAFFYSKH